MSRAGALAGKVESLVLAAIEDGEVERKSLRQIVVGPGRLKDVLHVWVNDSWEDYGEYGEDSAIAAISNAEWLDAVDRIEASATNTVSPPPPADRDAAYRAQEERRKQGFGLLHPDPKVAEALDARVVELRRDIEEALRLLATGGGLGTFPHLVGLLRFGLSPSGYADLVAFHHPQGAHPLLPVHEHEEETDVYTWAALVPEGVRVFYPEGDGDGLSSANGLSKSRLFRFAEMRYWYAEDDEVYFRLEGALFDTRLSHGHCHDEWGGPSQEEVDEALLAHFARHPELRLDAENPPLPEETAAWQRFVSLFVECRLERWGLVDAWAKKDALHAVPTFLAALPAEHPARARLVSAYAEKLLEKKRHAEALAILDGLDAKTRLREWRQELECLYALGHFEEVVARCAELETEEEDKLDEARPWKAMALASLGYPQDALALLDAKPRNPRDRDEHRCAWARAHALRKSDPAGAAASLWRALETGTRWLEHAERDFHDAPAPVRSILERRRDLETQASVQADLLAGLEKRVTPAIIPYDARAAEARAADGWKLAGRAERQNGSKGALRALLPVGTDAVVSAGEGGLIRVELADPAAPRILGEIAREKDVSFDKLAQSGNHLYAECWSAGIRVFDNTDRAKPKLVGRCPIPFDEPASDIAVGDGFLVAETRAGVLLYDLADPVRPDPVAVIAASPDTREPDPPNGLAVRRHHVFLTSYRGLIVADVRDRRAPRPIALLSPGDDRKPNRLDLFDDLAVIAAGDGVWLVDVRDPANPKSLGFVPGLDYRSCVRAGTKLLLLTGARKVVTIDMANREKPHVAGQVDFRDAKDEHLVMGYPNAALFLDGRLVVVDDDSVLSFVRVPRPAAKAQGFDPAPKIAAAEPRLVSWVEERLKEVKDARPEFRAGALMLERWDKTLRLTLDGARSFAGLDAGPVIEEPPQFEVELPELLRRKGESEGITEYDPPAGATEEEKRRFSELAAAAWEASIDRVLRAVPGTPAFKAIASGRVHVLSGGALIRLIGTAADASRPWQPYRREVPERKVRTLEERIEDWDELEKNIARAKSDPEVKALVLRMAAHGSSAAVRISTELPEQDESAVLEAFSRAILSGRVDENSFDWIAERKDRPAAAAVLEQLFQGAVTTLRLGANPDADEEEKLIFARGQVLAAIALGRAEDDTIVALVKRMLDVQDNPYALAELAAEVMEHMERRLPELLPHLRGWVERADEHENRLPLIARHLYRAGHPEPPPALLAQAAREKGDERYHSMKTGIKILDEAEWYENDACQSERLWTGKRLAERVAELKAKGDATSPVWPKEWPPEPHPASWNYLLRSAWPHLEKAGNVDWLVGRLAAARPGADFASDRAMVLCVLNHYAFENDVNRLMALAESVLRAPAGTFAGEDEDGDEVYDEDVKRRVRRQLTAARVVKGFALGREGKLAEARAHADAALRDDPRDGQALFLDARLAWLEAGDPGKGIDRAKANLEKIDPHDDAGAGRLLNLVGCALDELKRWDDAVLWFEKAAQAHRDPMYLANLAEVHEKRGDLESARKYAQQAKRKGAKSDLVNRILAEHGDEEADEEDDEEEEEEGDELGAGTADDEGLDAEEDTVADQDDEEDA